jgi:hypothetical protein
MQVTTVILFDLKGSFNQFWGFAQVPLAGFLTRKIPGLTFFKSMGSGSAGGFGAWPSFSKYAWLMVWEDQSQADAFFAKNTYFKNYQKRCSSTQILYLRNIMSHGKWSGVNPFVATGSPSEDAKVVVLTRARIRFNKLWDFWQKVGNTAKDLYKFDELEFAIGVGELPLIQQATVSIWTNMDAVKRYAYQHEAHKNVIQLTRKNNWYSEELFARFYLERKESL